MFTGKDKKIYDKIIKQLNENAEKKKTKLNQDMQVKEPVKTIREV